MRRPPRRTYALLIVACGLMNGMRCWKAPPPEPATIERPAVHRPTDNSTTTLKVEPDERLRLAFDLEAGDALVATIDQRGVDIEAWGHPPKGIASPWLHFDSPNGGQGIERACAVAPERGRYEMEIHGFANSGPGQLEVATHVARPAQPRDRLCEQALLNFRRGLEANRGTDRETARRALVSARDALRDLGWSSLALVDDRDLVSEMASQDGGLHLGQYLASEIFQTQRRLGVGARGLIFDGLGARSKLS